MLEVQHPAPQHVSNFLEVADAKKPRKAKGTEQKQQSSSGLRKERSVPSKKSDSMKSQAGKRSNLVPMSSSAVVQKSAISTSTCSSKKVSSID